VSTQFASRQFGEVSKMASSLRGVPLPRHTRKLEADRDTDRERESERKRDEKKERTNEKERE